jgi:hypothetical protein
MVIATWGRGKIGSDIRALTVLYGISLRCVQRENREGRDREEGFLAPREDRVCIEEVGCPRLLLRPHMQVKGEKNARTAAFSVSQRGFS